MPGRVLNFSEFFGKYSSEDGDSNQNLDNFTQSSSNFEEGFDDSTYDQNQLGPNRPVSGGEETPSQPGENGTSVFNSAIDQSMDAPDENEMPDETEGDLELDNLDEPEETDLDDDGDSEEDDSEEVPEPEAGANPKKEKVEESRKFKGLKGFSQFINESDYDPYSEEYDEYPEDYEEDYEEDDYDFGMNPDSEIEGYFPDDFCPNCGEELGYTPEGTSCGCNM
jgi:hypothetical protein